MRKIIFWDFDGTLSHPGAIWGGVIADVMGEYTDNVSTEIIREHLHTGYTWHTPEIHYAQTGALWWENMFLHFSKLYEKFGISAEKHCEINAKVRSRIISADTYTLFDGAAEVLRECAKIGENYILSNNYPELPDVIKALGIGEYICGYVVSAQIGYEKPHAGIFAHALAVADADPKRDICVMIGDNPKADIMGGKAAGFTTIFAHATKEEKPCEYADHYAAAMGDIPDVIRAIG